MENYSALKKSQIKAFASKLMELGTVKVRKICQFSFIYGC